MRRQQIIAIVVVLLLAGGAGAGYQFYFRPALEKFAEDKQYLEALNTKLKSLKNTFPNGKPEAAVARVKEKIQPWNETLEQRARQFSIRDFMKIEQLPKTEVLRAYYEQTAQKMVNDLVTELIVKGVYFAPPTDSLYFQMARPGTLTSKRVNEIQVKYWLSTIKLGTSITRMLIDSDVLGIEDLTLWAPIQSGDGFTTYAFGISMYMTLDQFCKFLERMNGDDTMCISVAGFRATNSALRAYLDPPLKIDLVFQIDHYKYEPAPPSAVAKAAPAPGGASAAPGAAPANQSDAVMQQLRERRATSAAQANAAGAKKSWWRSLLPW